jgi:hypothetical protein
MPLCVFLVINDNLYGLIFLAFKVGIFHEDEDIP